MRNALALLACSTLALSACQAEYNKETGREIGAPSAPMLSAEGVVTDAPWSLPLWKDPRAKTPEEVAGKDDAPREEPRPSLEDLAQLRRDALAAHTEGRFPRAISLWRKAIEIDGEDAFLHLALTRTLAASGDATGAASSARTAWEKGAQDLAFYSGEVFSLIANDPAWIGLQAELKARADADNQE